jgi:hypothetical protein
MSRSEAIQKVLDSDPDGRRSQTRKPFADNLRIAPYDGSTHPDDEDFYEVSGKDLSASGMGFFTPDPPKGEIVLALGDRSASIYLTGTVVHVRPGFSNANNNTL